MGRAWRHKIDTPFAGICIVLGNVSMPAVLSGSVTAPRWSERFVIMGGSDTPTRVGEPPRVPIITKESIVLLGRLSGSSIAGLAASGSLLGHDAGFWRPRRP